MKDLLMQNAECGMRNEGDLVFRHFSAETNSAGTVPLLLRCLGALSDSVRRIAKAEAGSEGADLFYSLFPNPYSLSLIGRMP